MKKRIFLSVLILCTIITLMVAPFPSTPVEAKGGSLLSAFLTSAPCSSWTFSGGYPYYFTCVGVFNAYSTMSVPLPRVFGVYPFYIFAGMPGAVGIDWDPAGFATVIDKPATKDEGCTKLSDAGNEKLNDTYVKTFIQLVVTPSNPDDRPFNISTFGGNPFVYGRINKNYPQSFSLISEVNENGWSSSKLFSGGLDETSQGVWQGPYGITSANQSNSISNRYISVSNNPDFIFISSPTSSYGMSGSSVWYNGEPGIRVNVINTYRLIVQKGYSSYDQCHTDLRYECVDNYVDAKGKDHCRRHEWVLYTWWEQAGGKYDSEPIVVGEGTTNTVRFFTANADVIIPIFQSQPLLVRSR